MAETATAVKPGVSKSESAAAMSQLPHSPKRFVLTGFMGAGKTTVGRQLAQRLGWQFIDVDGEIECQTGSTVAELFRAHGEPWFRDLEHETTRRLLASSEVVVALGGGAIEDERTRTLLLASTESKTGRTSLDDICLVNLEASLDTLLNRCFGTESIRPVLADRNSLEARYRRRLPLYRLAHLTISVDDRPPEAVVDAILELCRESLREKFPHRSPGPK